MDAPTTNIPGTEAPLVFADGLEVGFTNGGLKILLKTNDAKIMLLMLPYCTGKTLADSLNQIFQALEDTTGRPQLDFEEMGKVVATAAEQIGAKITRAHPRADAPAP